MGLHLNGGQSGRWMRESRKTWLLALGAVLLIAVALTALLREADDIATASVQRGEFVIDVGVRGEIDALNSTNVSIPRGRRRLTLQIVEMAEEGTQVQEGDFLLQLDTSEAQQAVETTQNKLATVKAELESSKASMASGMAQLESQLERETYNYEQAQLTQSMMQYEAESKRKEQELNMKKAELFLEQARRKIVSQKVIDRATLVKAELKIRQAEAELQEAEKAVASLTLTAPIDGLVVYHQVWSGGRMKKVQVGDTPWPGMAVMGIPDLSVMQAKVTVNEVDISKIAKDQNVVITVDALDGETYYGKTTRIAPLARREQSTNTKVFDIEATIDSTDHRLRPGMTCDCRIISDRIPDALFVPLQAVFEKESETVVYVMSGRRPKRRVVKVGSRNKDTIIVKEGLEQGELVCLRDPTIPMEELGEDAWSPSDSPEVTAVGK